MKNKLRLDKMTYAWRARADERARIKREHSKRDQRDIAIATLAGFRFVKANFGWNSLEWPDVWRCYSPSGECVGWNYDLAHAARYCLNTLKNETGHD